MLTKVLTYWNDLQPYRNERQRCKRYTYGDQWQDRITVDGRDITEEQYIRSQGNVPLKNNLIRRIIRNVLGVFRNNYTLPTFEELRRASPVYLPADSALEALYRRTLNANSMAEIYCRVLEEYLIGGLAVVRKRVTTSPLPAVYTDIVRPESFFFNSDAVDPRGWDTHTLGEIHTLTAEARERFDGNAVASRIFEIWHLTDAHWRYLFIDEEGRMLKEGPSPYPSGSHPYVMKAYPFTDGEIHSFVADCIDQQRYINRLITLHDWTIRSTAKGVLLLPESAIPEDLTLEDIAAQWSRYDGVIRYKAKAGVPLPQQVSNTAGNIGVSDLLGVQLKMMEDVSGINAALQGQLSSGAVSGTLYEQQTRHALTGLTDIMEGYRSFLVAAALKDLDFLRLL